MTENLQSYLNFARQLAWEAGRLTLAHFQTGVRADYKSDDTPVTVADREAERLIRSRIESTWPEHGILGEEFGELRPGASHRWIVDPIDGTKSFISGVPLFGVLLALEIDGVSRVGVTYFPGLDEMVSAAEGLGCSWNGRTCRVSPQRDLRRAIIAHADTAFFEVCGKGEAWRRLQQAVYYRAGWCDAYGYALVATGRVEAMLDPELKIWDCAPLDPILREAGGYFGDWKGRAGIDVTEGLATSAEILPEILKVLAG